MDKPFARDEFIQFLLRAKRNTYAGQGDDASVAPALSGSKQLEYAEGPFLYRDVHYGMTMFAGQETVYYEGQPVWSMSYGGAVALTITAETAAILQARMIYHFLREALERITLERPYRGPDRYERGEYIYEDRSHGDLNYFAGHETIVYQGKQVYDLHYTGGFLR